MAVLADDKTVGQRVAADPHVSSWVSAAAGTGKTHVLTGRVLRLLLAGTAPGKILCLTFTKAAAAEMSARVFQRLGDWTIGSDDDLKQSLFELLGRVGEEAEVTLARQLFARALETPGGLKIQTIHSFCEAVLGRFPLEAGLPAHFQVMDERTAEELFLEAREAVLADAGGETRALLAGLAEYLDENGFQEIMSKLMNERGRLNRLFRRYGGVGGAGGLETMLRETLQLSADENEAGILAGFADESRFDAAALRHASDEMCRSGKRDSERGRRIANWLAAPAHRTAHFDDYKAAYVGKTTGAVHKAIATGGLIEKHPDIEPVLAAEAERVLAADAKLKAARVLRANGYLLRLGKAMLEAYEAEKRRRAVLDYNDLILHTRDLVSEPGLAPWILYKLDGGLDHILIDEAQDTNPEQWEIVQALAEEFFAGRGARDQQRTIFAVGDPKQSIYSFQRADPAAFVEMQTFFKAKVEAVGKMWRPVELNLSFRSVPSILRVVDKVFESGDAAAGVQFGDHQVRHISNRRQAPGLVELWPLEPVAEKTIRAPWTLPLIQEREDSASVRLAMRVAGQISRWLNEGEILQSAGRAIRAGDIMILLRSRGTVMEEFVRALKARGLPVAGVDRMALREQLAVMDLLALARFLLLPEDDLNLAVVLKGPLIGLGETELYDLAHDRGGSSLWRRLRTVARDQAGYRPALEYLENLLRRTDFGTPFELFAEILGTERGREKILARLGFEANDPIDELLGRALEFERSHAPSLQAFLAWIGRGEETVKREFDNRNDEIRIMTVHGAKGLEAPIVFLPQTISKPRPPSGLFWLEAGEAPRLPLWLTAKDLDDPVSSAVRAAALREQSEEYHRLLYVAMTRAEDRLYICGWEGRGEPAADCWYRLVAEAMGIIGEAFTSETGATGYRFADQHPGAPKEKTDKRETVAESPPPAWLHVPAPAEPAPPKPLVPSRPSADEPRPFGPLGDDGERYRRGRIVHALLQLLAELPVPERPAAAARYLSRQAADFDAAARQRLSDEVLGVLAAPEFAHLFAPGSRAEVPISGVVGERVISGQIDRLQVTDSSVLLVDFKSNRPYPAEVAATPVIYLRQLAAYRALLRQVYADKTITCGLLWTDGPVLMEIPVALLERHAP